MDFHHFQSPMVSLMCLCLYLYSKKILAEEIKKKSVLQQTVSTHGFFPRKDYLIFPTVARTAVRNMDFVSFELQNLCIVLLLLLLGEGED